ncbi:ribonuclease P protein component 1 [Candidatus Woesearchaeota archaeon CG10_big_fil_rev_8_21_14_0_10_44_13]|nr:MAG: ribonuclease P protein component 1 [Candidatus Woesearchaeota archaeon CG10_big_fil_rev_8_21_14_0_10_44_13]
MKDTLKKELIGKEIRIVEAKNKTNEGIEGKIIDETKNMITISTKKGSKKLIKEEIRIKLLREKITIDGKLLVGRPEDRIKKKI